MVLETSLNTFNGIVYASVTYFFINYAAFTDPANLTVNFLIYVAILVIQTNGGCIFVQLCALAAPNQDMALALAGGKQLHTPPTSRPTWLQPDSRASEGIAIVRLETGGVDLGGVGVLMHVSSRMLWCPE